MKIRKKIYYKMKKGTLKSIIPILIITLLFNFAVVFAEAGQGGGGGGGGQSSSPGIPGQKPLNLSSATLEDGSKLDVAGGITTKPKITLTFDKNVVNMLYWENNAKCFSLVSASNEVVPLKVTKIDDTVDFNQRQNIFIQPSAELKPGTSYVLKISPELTAKNGIKLGGSTANKGITLNFKTKGQAPSAAVTPAAPSTNKPSTSTTPAPAPTPTPTPAETNKPGTSTTPAPAPSATQTPTTEQKTTGTETNKATTPSGTPSGVNTQETPQNEQVASRTNPMFNWGIIILVLAIVCWIAFEIIIRKKKNKGKK